MSDEIEIVYPEDVIAELRKEVERLTNAYDITHRALFAATERNIKLEQQLAEANKRLDRYREELQNTASDLDDGLNTYEQIGVKARINETLKL